MKILIFGITGMLGSCIYKYFSIQGNYKVIGVSRDASKNNFFKQNSHATIMHFNELEDFEQLENFLEKVKPDIILNCIGVIKQKIKSYSPYKTLFLNSYFPHLLDKLASNLSFKLIHFSTDCVFDGISGSYTESDIPLPKDYYGMTKLLGEVNRSDSLTLRTSFIGHELNSSFQLLNWFLSSKGSIKGYSKAIYTGMPTIQIAQILEKYVIPNRSLRGLYHLSSSPITKHDLLQLFLNTYNYQISILEDDKVVVDRSLNSTSFKSKTGFDCPPWNEMIKKMYEFQKQSQYL